MAITNPILQQQRSRTIEVHSTREFCLEIFVITVTFILILAMVVLLYFFLPNMTNYGNSLNGSSRHQDLRHVFTCIHFTCAFASIFVNFAGVWFCWKSRILWKAIRLLLIGDSLARCGFSILLSIGFYRVLSTFVPFLLTNTIENEVYEWIVFFLQPCVNISGFLQITLALNRFIALSFNGLYYHRFRKYPWLQLVSPVALGLVSMLWGRGYFSARIMILSATISLDFMLIYKMIKTRITFNNQSERFLLAQTIANNLPATYTLLICPFIFLIFTDWLPIFSDFMYHLSNFLYYSGGQLSQGMAIIYWLIKLGDNSLSTHRVKPRELPVIHNK